MCVDPNGVRTCACFYHDRCLQTITSRVCVECRADFSYRRKVPRIEMDPKGWFDAVDRDGSRSLDRQELLVCLRAQYPLDPLKLERILTREWARWDADSSGAISESEFLRPRRGLLAYLIRKKDSLTMAPPPVRCPDIRTDPSEFFSYFDSDNSGFLDKDEVVRGLIKCFQLTGQTRITFRLRLVMDAVWPLFDENGDGYISRAEFLRPKEGLAASITASLLQS